MICEVVFATVIGQTVEFFRNKLPNRCYIYCFLHRWPCLCQTYYNQQLLPALNSTSFKFQMVMINDSSLLDLTWQSNYPYKLPYILSQSDKKGHFFSWKTSQRKGSCFYNDVRAPQSLRYCRVESRVEYCYLNPAVTIVICLLRPGK